MERSRPWWKSILLNARALGFGVVVAVVSVTAYVWVEESLSSGNIITPAETARIAAAFSAVIALQLLLVCVPLWLLLGRLGWTNWVSAMVLGFIAPLGYLTFDDWLNGRSELIVEGLLEGLPFGFFGALAGLVVWWTRPKPPIASA